MSPDVNLTRFRWPIAALLAMTLAVGCTSDPTDANPTVEPDSTTTEEPTPTEPAVAPTATDEPTPDAISVASALEDADGGLILVEGFLLVEDDVVHLCSALAESFPPQCGGPSAVVEGLDLDTVPDLTTGNGVTWTDQPVQLDAILIDGLLSVVEITRE